MRDLLQQPRVLGIAATLLVHGAVFAALGTLTGPAGPVRIGGAGVRPPVLQVSLVADPRIGREGSQRAGAAEPAGPQAASAAVRNAPRAPVVARAAPAAPPTPVAARPAGPAPAGPLTGWPLEMPAGLPETPAGAASDAHDAPDAVRDPDDPSAVATADPDAQAQGDAALAAFAADPVSPDPVAMPMAAPVAMPSPGGWGWYSRERRALQARAAVPCVPPGVAPPGATPLPPCTGPR